MMTEKKLTKRDVLNYMIKTYGNDEMVVAYATHEIELLDRKASVKTPSKVQVENENIKGVILNVLTELAKPSTITEIQNANPELAVLSNQKMSALLTQLKNADKIVKTVDKKKAYFSINA